MGVGRAAPSVPSAVKKLDDIALEANDRAAVEQAASVLRKVLPVARVVLFGSKARGEGRGEESDIDLLVLTRRAVSAQEEQAAIDALFDVELAMDVVISLLIVPEEDWTEGVYQVLPIRREVERDGVTA